jgi:hypothetical protein
MIAELTNVLLPPTVVIVNTSQICPVVSSFQSRYYYCVRHGISKRFFHPQGVYRLRKFASILLDGDNLTGCGHNVGSIFRKYLFPFRYTERQTETYIKACSRQIVIEEVQHAKSRTTAIEP